MEGRAIARPNHTTLSTTDRREIPSMEGRAIARPNEPAATPAPTAAQKPSMEGRAIARPNCTHRRSLRSWLGPSMEGRAIARPNL